MDWNHDGYLDILSGCYWTSGADGGYIYMLAGNGSLDFSPAEHVVNAAGDPLQNEEISEANGRMAANQTSSICTHQHAVDYDADGDLDLVVGCFATTFYLYENQGSSGSIALSETPVRLPIESPSYHSAPHLVDWDDDGDLDLLSGTAQGGVVLSENTGTRTNPIWAEFEWLIPSSSKQEQTTANGGVIEPSPSTRVWATDWNEDGQLDLLVGDCATIVNPKEGIDAAELARRTKDIADRMAAVAAKRQTIMPQYQQALESGEEPNEELTLQMAELQDEHSKLYHAKKEFQDSQRTGFVWLYLRK